MGMFQSMFNQILSSTSSIERTKEIIDRRNMQPSPEEVKAKEEKAQRSARASERAEARFNAWQEAQRRKEAGMQNKPAEGATGDVIGKADNLTAQAVDSYQTAVETARTQSETLSERKKILYQINELREKGIINYSQMFNLWGEAEKKIKE